MTSIQRLDKIITERTQLSRRAVGDVIKAGRVRVDEVILRTPQTRVDIHACITLDNTPLRPPGRRVLLLHKPAGVVCATHDAEHKTVLDILPAEYRDLLPVGRLDKDTEGLLLLTDDGALLHHLISPRHAVQKQYYAEHENIATQADIEAFEAGLELRDGSICLPAQLEPLGPGRSRITIGQGMYHQVRRMMAARGMHVLYLRREAIGALSLAEMPISSYRLLSEQELKLL